MRATDVMIGGKRALIAEYGDVDKGCAFAGFHGGIPGGNPGNRRG